jgi:methylenetetrahydrofolate reductase (NADPH)
VKTFKQALQSAELTITAELSLQHAITAQQVLQQAEELRGSVAAVQVTENQFSANQMSATAAAGLLIKNGFDVITGLNGRDRNRIALHSDLLGLRAMGITSLMLSTGDMLSANSENPAKPVFDVDCRELITIASGMNEVEGMSPANEFLIGTDTRVFTPGPDWESVLLPVRARADAGAQFLQTQLCLDLDVLRQYMHRLVDARLTWSYSVIVSIAPLPSAQMARELLENGSGCLIPPDIIERLESADDPAQEGVESCAKLMREIAEIPGVSGVNLVNLGDISSLLAAIRYFNFDDGNG